MDRNVRTKMKNKLELAGTTLKKMDSAKNWHKDDNFIGRNKVCNTIAQENTTLAMAIAGKGSISDVFRLSHLERNGTGNELTHKKDTHRQILCVQYH